MSDLIAIYAIASTIYILAILTGSLIITLTWTGIIHLINTIKRKTTK